MDTRKRRKEGGSAASPLSLQTSPKRARVHAQRKFAQGSQPNSPVITPAKDIKELRDRTVSNESRSKYVTNGTAQYLPPPLPPPVPPAITDPNLRPKTEDFLTFLCFRGTTMMPPELEFFETPQLVEANSDSRSQSPCPEEKPKQVIRKKSDDLLDKKGIVPLSKENIRKNLEQIDDNSSFSPPITRVTRSSASLTPTPSFLSSPPSSDISPTSDSPKRKLTRKQLLLKKAMIMKARTLQVRRRERQIQLRSKHDSSSGIVTRSGTSSVPKNLNILTNKKLIQSKLTRSGKTNRLSRILKRLGPALSPLKEERVKRITRSKVEIIDEESPIKEELLSPSSTEGTDDAYSLIKTERLCPAQTYVNSVKEEIQDKKTNKKEKDLSPKEEKKRNTEKPAQKSLVLRKIRARRLNAMEALLRETRGPLVTRSLRKTNQATLVSVDCSGTTSPPGERLSCSNADSSPKKKVATRSLRAKSQSTERLSELKNKRQLRARTASEDCVNATMSGDLTGVRSRPVRKTKQVAEVYLELISQKLAKESRKVKSQNQSYGECEDDDDDTISISSIKELKSLAGNKSEIDMEKCIKEISERHEKDCNERGQGILPSHRLLKIKVEDDVIENENTNCDDGYDQHSCEKRELRSKALIANCSPPIEQDSNPLIRSPSFLASKLRKNTIQDLSNIVKIEADVNSELPPQNEDARISIKGKFESLNRTKTSQSTKLGRPMQSGSISNSCRVWLRKPFRRKRALSDSSDIIKKRSLVRRHSHDLRHKNTKQSDILKVVPKLEGDFSQQSDGVDQKDPSRSTSLQFTKTNLNISGSCTKASEIGIKNVGPKEIITKSPLKKNSPNPSSSSTTERKGATNKSLRKISHSKRTSSLDGVSKKPDSDILQLTKKFASMDCVSEMQEKLSVSRPNSLYIPKRRVSVSGVVSADISENVLGGMSPFPSSLPIRKHLIKRRNSSLDQDRLNEVLESVAKDFEKDIDETHYDKIEKDLNSGNKSPNKSNKSFLKNSAIKVEEGESPIIIPKIDNHWSDSTKADSPAEIFVSSPGSSSPATPTSGTVPKKTPTGKKLCDVVRNLQERKQAESPHSFTDSDTPIFLQDIKDKDSKSTEKEKQVSGDSAAFTPLDSAPALNLLSSHPTDISDEHLDVHKSLSHYDFNCTSDSSAPEDPPSSISVAEDTPHVSQRKKSDSSTLDIESKNTSTKISLSQNYEKDPYNMNSIDSSSPMTNKISNIDLVPEVKLSKPTIVSALLTDSSTASPEHSKIVSNIPSKISFDSVSSLPMASITLAAPMVSNPIVNAIVTAPLVYPVVSTALINPAPTSLMRPLSLIPPMSTTSLNTSIATPGSAIRATAPISVVNPILSVPVINSATLTQGLPSLGQSAKISLPLLPHISRFGSPVTITPSMATTSTQIDGKVSKSDNSQVKSLTKQILIAPKPSKSNFPNTSQSSSTLLSCGSIKQIHKQIQIAPKLLGNSSQAPAVVGHPRQAAPMLPTAQMGHIVQGIPHQVQAIQTVQALSQVQSVAQNFSSIPGLAHAVQTVVPSTPGLNNSHLVAQQSPAKIISQPMFVSSSVPNIVPTPFDLTVHRPLHGTVGAVAQVVGTNLAGKVNARPPNPIMTPTSHPLVTIGPGNADASVISSLVPIHPGQQPQFLTVNMMPVGTSGQIGSIICPPTVSCVTPINAASNTHLLSSSSSSNTEGVCPPFVSSSDTSCHVKVSATPIVSVVSTSISSSAVSAHHCYTPNRVIVSNSPPSNDSIQNDTSNNASCVDATTIDVPLDLKAIPKVKETPVMEAAAAAVRLNTPSITSINKPASSGHGSDSCRFVTHSRNYEEILSVPRPAITPTVISQALSKLLQPEKNLIFRGNVEQHGKYSVCPSDARTLNVTHGGLAYSPTTLVLPKVVTTDSCMAGQKAITKVSQSSPPYVLSTQASDSKLVPPNQESKFVSKELLQEARSLDLTTKEKKNEPSLHIKELNEVKYDKPCESIAIFPTPKFASKSITLTPVKSKPQPMQIKPECSSILSTETFYSSNTTKKISVPKCSLYKAENKFFQSNRSKIALEIAKPVSNVIKTSPCKLSVNPKTVAAPVNIKELKRSKSFEAPGKKESVLKKTLFKAKNQDQEKPSDAFSPLNESSVYAFEPELEPPLEVTNPFSKRFKVTHTSPQKEEMMAKQSVASENMCINKIKPDVKIPALNTVHSGAVVDSSSAISDHLLVNSCNIDIKPRLPTPQSPTTPQIRGKSVQSPTDTGESTTLRAVRKTTKTSRAQLLSELKNVAMGKGNLDVYIETFPVSVPPPLNRNKQVRGKVKRVERISEGKFITETQKNLIPLNQNKNITKLNVKNALSGNAQRSGDIALPDTSLPSKTQNCQPATTSSNSDVSVDTCTSPLPLTIDLDNSATTADPEQVTIPLAKPPTSLSKSIAENISYSQASVKGLKTKTLISQIKHHIPLTTNSEKVSNTPKTTSFKPLQKVNYTKARTSVNSASQSSSLVAGQSVDVANVETAPKSTSLNVKSSNTSPKKRETCNPLHSSPHMQVHNLPKGVAKGNKSNNAKQVKNTKRKTSGNEQSSAKSSVKSASIAIQCDLDDSQSDKSQDEMKANESGTQTEGPSKFPLPPSASPFYYLPLAMATLGDKMPAQLVQQMLAKTQGYVGATEFGMILQQAAQLAQRYHTNIQQQNPADPVAKPLSPRSGGIALQKALSANLLSSIQEGSLNTSQGTGTSKSSGCQSTASQNDIASTILKMVGDESLQGDRTTDNQTDDESDSQANLDIIAKKISELDDDISCKDDDDDTSTKENILISKPEITPVPSRKSLTKRVRKEEEVVVKRRSGRSSTLAATKATESDMQGVEQLRRSRKAKRAAVALAKEEAWSSSSEAPLSPTMSPDLLRGWPPPRRTSPTPSQSSEGTTSSTPSQRSRVSAPHSRRQSPASSTDSRRGCHTKTSSSSAYSNTKQPRQSGSGGGSGYQAFPTDPFHDRGHLQISDNNLLARAPSFFPTDEEFNEPLDYIEKIRPEAEQFGLCRIIPPNNFRPECRVNDDMRFTAHRQYIHKIMRRWGPNVRTLCAIKKCLSKQNIELSSNPLIGGLELDLVQLYEVVQQLGGLMTVIEKELWFKVADHLRIPKSAQDRITKLDSLYCKYLLPYALLSDDERRDLLAEVDLIHNAKKSTSSSNDSSDSEDEEEDEELTEFIIKGKSIALNAFYRIARNIASQWQPDPSGLELDERYWEIVKEKTHHLCVHAASIDTAEHGYGFPSQKNSSNAKHPWNLKNLCQNPNSVLRSMANIIGVSAPTLHVGMIFSTVCWYRDPHSLPWIEYLHTGASKIWYGVASNQEKSFHLALKKLVPDFIKDSQVWLPSDTTMVPPEYLVEEEVKVSRVVQEPGQFVVVFPGAFSSSVCAGYLISESAFFARPQYFDRAIASFATLRECSEPSMFSLDRLVLSVASDSKASLESLLRAKILLQKMIEREKEERELITKLGLVSSERMPSADTFRKRRNRYPDEEEENMCEVCRQHVYISLVRNADDDSMYCLQHAAIAINRSPSILEHCKFMYTYSLPELTSALKQMSEGILQKSARKTAISIASKKGRGIERIDSFSSTSSSNL